MSTETIRLSRRMVIIGLCVALLLTSTLILAPVVGAASDTNKTETETNDNINIVSAEDQLLTERAITIDEAKKEALEVVSEQLAIQEAAKKAEAEKSTEASTTAKSSDTSASSTEASSSSTESAADSSSTSDENDDDYVENTVTASSSGEFLLDIDNPDYSYTGCSITLSDSDRDQVARMLMGEAGGMGFDGMALVAQCIRDTYVCGSYGSMQQLFSENGYYGSTSYSPSSTAYDVVNYIFDQGGSAVQHSIRVFYASNLCESSWHEAQDYVCSYGYVRFFDF